MRGLGLTILLLLGLALLPLASGLSSNTAATPQPGKPELTRPRIMSEAADQAAMPATSQSAAQLRADQSSTQPVTPLAAVSTRPRKEVLGFVNAGNLGSPNVGYTTWNLGLLTTAVYFSLHINSGDGALVRSGVGYDVWISSTLTSFVRAAHANGTKVIVSINLHDFSTSPTNQVCQGLTSTNAANTISEVLTQVRNANIDGVNVDYEATDTTCANGLSARSQFVSFVQNLRAAAPAGMFIVVDSYSGSAEDNLEFFNITGLSPYIDAFFVMAYDMDFENSQNAPLNCTSYCMNPVSPLNTYRFNVSKSIAQYTALVPGSQVILGQPYYGRRGCVANLTDVHQTASSVGSTTYAFAVNTATESGVTNFSAHRDPGDGVSEWDTFHDSTPGIACNRMQYWDDVASLGAKYDLVNSSGIRGVGIFTLDYAGPAAELWNSLAAHFTCPGTNFMAGDFNGDRKADLTVIGSQSVCVLASTGSGFSIPAVWASIPFYGSRSTLIGDVTGDGKADLVAVNGGQTFVMPSLGTAFAAPAAWSNTPFYGTRGTYLADVSGDGKADLVAVNDGSVWIMLSTGSTFAAPTQWSGTPFFGNVTTLLADIDADGKADMVAVNRGSTWVMISTGAGFNPPTQWSGTPFYGNLATTSVDLTGDKRADLLAINSGSNWGMNSTGTTLGAPVQWSGAPFYGQYATLWGDVSGDGKADLIAVNTLSVWVEQSTGVAFSAPAQWLSGPP
jgi:spore germination protein YaaH